MLQLKFTYFPYHCFSTPEIVFSGRNHKAWLPNLLAQGYFFTLFYGSAHMQLQRHNLAISTKIRIRIKLSFDQQELVNQKNSHLSIGTPQGRVLIPLLFFIKQYLYRWTSSRIFYRTPKISRKQEVLSWHGFNFSLFTWQKRHKQG